MYTIIILEDVGKYAFNDVIARSDSYDEIRAMWQKLDRIYRVSSIRWNLD